MNQAEQQRLLAILEYWHKIEFFIPFDLNQITDVEDQSSVRLLQREHLAALPPQFFLNWQVPSGYEIDSFGLFLGVFDKSEVNRVCTASGAPESMAELEKTELAGRTCFARINLNALGEPLFDPVSVSTLPWALGRPRDVAWSGLNLDAFADSQLALQDSLRDFAAARTPMVVSDEAGNTSTPLSGMEIAALADLLRDWANFHPSAAQPLAVLEVRTRKKRPPKDADAPEANRTLDFGDPVEPSIDILNSFYLDDLEQIIRALRGGKVPATLAAYLTPLAQEERIDLYSPAGRSALAAMLNPANMQRGHWLEDSGYALSLMQQFAINGARTGVAERGIFSVNGPPGTGKTTLLRELFADNIVRRASVLACLDRAADAFIGKVAVAFEGVRDPITIARLRPELTGFEMVVTSSNNAAVENISTDLPKPKQLGKEWARTRYFESVARRVAADGNGANHQLTDEEAPWGLISCALGNGRNRHRFISNFYDDDWDKTTPRKTVHMQNIRQWLASHQGISFAQAAREFRETEHVVEKALAEQAQYAALWQSVGTCTEEQFLQNSVEALALAEQEMQASSEALEQALTQQDTLLAAKKALQEDERLVGLTQPGFFARLFRTAKARAYQAAVQANAEAQRQTARDISAVKLLLKGELEPRCERGRNGLHDALRIAQSRSREWEDNTEMLRRARLRFTTLVAPDSLEELDSEKLQINGLWHEPALARLRSRLFAKALALHEAWLAEVAKKGGPGFGGNLLAVSKLLKNKRAYDQSHIPMVWQSLFMVVPVVSTTFASFARQFRGMGPESLGWLFIDEAGQAPPQSAVGSLWRARRAVVVGDPLQIEPVFTVPGRLVQFLSNLSPHTQDGRYAPTGVSVQSLADQANRHGALVGAHSTQPLWIGSPLRVHRRCVEPMFSLANAIAYEDKMVYGLAERMPPAGSRGLTRGPSRWIDVAAPVSYKQVVPLQVEFVLEVLLKLYRRDGKLPALYLITPFKAMRNELRARIMDLDWDRRLGYGRSPTTHELRQWCSKMVGTVHTFQGKEQGVVMLVLGADDSTMGAAQWAAATPNLLNVALTRAQHYIYIVGNPRVWGQLPHFSAACAQLAHTDVHEFLVEMA
ncbi:DEAD/DEAH box helicase [Janthinobacterium aquaticum]|uniref:DEAD/DEAH box helicase n=1 Tax=Janthinobacterium sp. FT58W TaxID=2654254 RepID=UPI001D02B269|nr:AAA domain-containing protein [Janthinobacterium sp. FT58W]